MSEYSKEFLELRKFSIEPDFSVHEVFHTLKEGKSIDIICEGFGFHEILKLENRCWVKVREERILFKDLYERIEMS